MMFHQQLNEKLWDLNTQDLIPEVKEKLFKLINRPYIDGLTLSGGDPLFCSNIADIEKLCIEFKERFPNKTIWLYTGYNWEQIQDLEGISDIDVIAEGEFIEELKDNNIHWVGSSNQRVIDVKETLKTGQIVLTD